MSSSLQSEVLSRIPDGFEFVSLKGNSLILRDVGRLLGRGHVLLELEKRLHQEVDGRLQVLLEPMGDLNKLRTRTRGVIV